MAQDLNAAAVLDHVPQTRNQDSDLAHGHPHDRDDKTGYSKGPVLEKATAPYQESEAHDLHRIRHADDMKMHTENADTEKAEGSPAHSGDADAQQRKSPTFYARYRIFFHLGIWLFFTG
jgi:CNT family concentrative nucleoside transporter